MSLNGRVALVTGSTRGLGKAIALELARRGAGVAMNYAHSRETAESAFAELRTVSRDSMLVGGDVTQPFDVDRMVAEVGERLGPIDVLVINATGPQDMKPFEDYEWSCFAAMYEFFVKSPMLLTKACLPHMKQQRWGRIVHITSEVFTMGWANFSAYAAAKGGQTGLARSNAREFAPFGVTVNMVAPGWIPVERHAGDPQAAKDAYVAEIPAGHFGKPHDVADAVAYLAGEGAGFVTGQCVHVNGGHTVQ
jgi:3-oxoacyl-[acyl-carrier protein] reductase